MRSPVPRRVLLIEDEPGLVMTLTDRLRAEGFEVGVAADGPSGLASATSEPWDVILLDVMLPGATGFDVCRDIRHRGVTTPIIMLTARSQVVDTVQGLRLGADDYVTKPFEMLELTARIDVQLRRVNTARPGSHPHRFGDVTLDARSAEVTRNGVLLDLSAREFLLLKYFLEHRGATISREQLLYEVWGYQATPTTRTVDVHVAWLRQKIEVNPRHPQFIVTVHGLGYKFSG